MWTYTQFQGLTQGLAKSVPDRARLDKIFKLQDRAGSPKLFWSPDQTEKKLDWTGPFFHFAKPWFFYDLG